MLLITVGVRLDSALELAHIHFWLSKTKSKTKTKAKAKAKKRHWKQFSDFKPNSDSVPQLNILDKLRNSNHDIEG